MQHKPKPEPQVGQVWMNPTAGSVMVIDSIDDKVIHLSTRAGNPNKPVRTTTKPLAVFMRDWWPSHYPATIPTPVETHQPTPQELAQQQKVKDEHAAQQLRDLIAQLKPQKAQLIEQRAQLRRGSPQAQQLTQDIADLTYQIHKAVDNLASLSNQGRVPYRLN